MRAYGVTMPSVAMWLLLLAVATAAPVTTQAVAVGVEAGAGESTATTSTRQRVARRSVKPTAQVRAALLLVGGRRTLTHLAPLTLLGGGKGEHVGSHAPPKSSGLTHGRHSAEANQCAREST
jgi:hypothetical protein